MNYDRRESYMGDEVFATAAFVAPIAWKLTKKLHGKAMNKLEQKQAFYNNLTDEEKKELKKARAIKRYKVVKIMMAICIVLELFAIVMGHFSFGDLYYFIIIAGLLGYTKYKFEKEGK